MITHRGAERHRTCFGHVSDMFRTRFGHVSDMFRTRFGHVSDTFRAWRVITLLMRGKCFDLVKTVIIDKFTEH